MVPAPVVRPPRAPRARIRESCPGSLTPGTSSTPLLTSTPNGRTACTASRDVLRREAAGENHLGLPRELGRPAPVGDLADAAGRTLEHDARRQRIRRLAAEAHDRQHLDVRGDLQFAQILDVGLKIIGLENAADLVHLHLQRMLRDRDAQDARRRERRELRRLSGRHLPRAGREHEADGIHIGRRGGADRIGTGDAANLDPHRCKCSHLGRHCACRVEDFLEQSGRILPAHQGRADQRQPVAQAGACAARRLP